MFLFVYMFHRFQPRFSYKVYSYIEKEYAKKLLCPLPRDCSQTHFFFTQWQNSSIHVEGSKLYQ